jgi:hypothetical protein
MLKAGNPNSEVKKVDFVCPKCDKIFLIIHNMLLPTYFQMDVICPYCSNQLYGESVKIYKSEIDNELQYRLTNLDDLK